MTFVHHWTASLLACKFGYATAQQCPQVIVCQVNNVVHRDLSSFHGPFLSLLGFLVLTKSNRSPGRPSPDPKLLRVVTLIVRVVFPILRPDKALNESANKDRLKIRFIDTLWATIDASPPRHLIDNARLCWPNNCARVTTRSESKTARRLLLPLARSFTRHRWMEGISPGSGTMSYSHRYCRVLTLHAGQLLVANCP